MTNHLDHIKKAAAHLSDHPDPYIRSLARAHPLREEVLCNALNHLRLPEESSGIDVGCGIGLPALLVAGMMGEGGT